MGVTLHGHILLPYVPENSDDTRRFAYFAYGSAYDSHTFPTFAKRRPIGAPCAICEQDVAVPLADRTILSPAAMADMRIADRQRARDLQEAALTSFLSTHFFPEGGGGGGLPRDADNQPVPGLFVETAAGDSAFLPETYLRSPFATVDYSARFPAGNGVTYRFAATVVAGPPMNLNDVQVTFPLVTTGGGPGNPLYRGLCTVRVRNLAAAVRIGAVASGTTYVSTWAVFDRLVKANLAESVSAYATAHVVGSVSAGYTAFSTIVNTANLSGSCRWNVERP